MTAPNSESGSMEQQIGNDNPDGIMVGQAAGSYVGFFGATPVVQQTASTTVTTTGMNSGTSGLYSTTTLNDAFITAVAGIQTALNNLGLTA
jgi:hypothetical protein